MDSIEETMMRMSYSQQAANLDGWEDVGMCRLGQDGGAGKNADLVERMGEVDWPVRIASSCRRQPQKSVALLTLASKITNKYSTMEEHGRASLSASFWYLYHLPHYFLVTGKLSNLLSFANPPKTYWLEMASLNSLVIKKSDLYGVALGFFIIALVFLIYMSVSLIFSIRCLNLLEWGTRFEN